MKKLVFLSIELYNEKIEKGNFW